jgi:choline kinase
MMAVIPAAGMASRLRPLTDNCHKAMLPLGTTTMLELILRNLRHNHIREVVIVTGYRAEHLARYVQSIAGAIRIRFVHNSEFLSTNNAFSLSIAAPLVAGHEFVLLDCDIVFEPEVLRRVLQAPVPNALAVHKRPGLGAEEMKVYSDDGLTVGHLTKQRDPEEAVGESIGIERFSADFSQKLFRVLDRHIADGKGRMEYYEDAFQELIAGGDKIHMVDVSDCLVVEVDYREDLERVKREILDRKSVV